MQMHFQIFENKLFQAQRDKVYKLILKYISTESLVTHLEMVSFAILLYANKLNLEIKKQVNWWFSGIIHDLDYEKYPEKHPLFLIEDILIPNKIDSSIIDAVKAHATDLTGKIPTTIMGKYLFACDELCGFIYAVSKVKKDEFNSLTTKSIMKKLKSKSFAAKINRVHIKQGADLIGSELSEHIEFLVKGFYDFKEFQSKIRLKNATFLN